MNKFALCLGSLILASQSFGCSLLQKDIVYDYEVDPQEMAQDLGPIQMGTFPEVDCTADDMLCAAVQSPISGATVSCDAAASGGKHCVAHYDLTVHQTINLSQQATFPSAITESPVINLVQVDEVRYWTGSGETVTVDTPPLDLYIGGSEAMAPTDSGVAKLGTIGAIPAGKPPSAKPDCTMGAATDKETACDMQLTEDGKKLLATLAKDFKKPFNIIIVGHLTIAGGEAVPSGKIDLFLQPVIGFHIPL